ncbi:uncharacterized protein LOC105216500 isoform X2 [Zeugodacus cucurbitae]|uniref:uncharacterized protein LOC105216500 isoform X2 n=1 Tax=Zeugodacus cucurbitae TaxID=28588 RepID=UPI0023D91026|nr:uncharacterized protein LOC105216500 isoform X2 [Zeugodacus cucurbitae]
MHSAAAAAVGGVTVTSQLTVFSNHKLATRRMVRTLSDLSLVFCYLVCGHHGFQSGVVLLQWQMVYLLHQLGLHTLHMRGATQCHTGNSLLLHSAKTCPCWVVKLYWYLHISAFVCATGLSFLYWAFIYPFSNFKVPEGIHRIEIIRLYRYFFEGPDNHICLAYFHNINSHAINSVLMIIDQVVVAFPTRMIHFIFPALIGIIYLAFSVVYYLIGGENVIGKPYIYRTLNWGEFPDSSALFACSGLLLVFPMCVLAFFIYKIRVWVSSSKCLS